MVEHLTADRCINEFLVTHVIPFGIYTYIRQCFSSAKLTAKSGKSWFTMALNTPHTGWYF